jgi:hypothetical protein
MPSFKLLAPTLATALLSVAAHAQTTSSCRLLVENKNDLWLVRPDGSVISRITSDGQLKPAAALQPGGNLVAYSTQDPARDLVLSDAAGHVVSQTSSGAQEAVVGLSWPSSATLRADIHDGPSTSQFQFFSLQPGNRLIRVPLDNARGAACAASPSVRQLACAGGDALTLDGKDLYYATDPFDSSTAAQSTNLTLGSSLITATSPALQVDFRQQTGTSVTLRVTTPDHQSQEQRVSTGATMPVTASGAATIGLEPVRTADPNTIKLVVKTSNTGYARFEGGLAWSPNGGRIAAVEANDAGQRTLLLLDRQMGQAAIQGRGGIDARLVLPITGPISAIRFLTNTAIRVEGARDAVEYTVPATGKVRSPSYVVKPLAIQAHAVSLTLDGSTVSATVRDWTCP